MKITVTLDVEGIPPGCKQERKITRRMCIERTDLTDLSRFKDNACGLAGYEVPNMIKESVDEFEELRDPVAEAAAPAATEAPAETPAAPVQETPPV